MEKWKELAKHLNTDEVKKGQLQHSLNLGTTTISCIPQELMIEWRSKNAKTATLEKFCEALKAAELNTTAEYLIEKFVPAEKVDSGQPENVTESEPVPAITSVSKEDATPITEEAKRLKE